MKTLLITLSLMATIVSTHAADGSAISANASAITFSPLLPFVASTALTGMLSTDTNVHKEARQILNEGQQYFQSGDMGLLIGKRVEELQDEQDMSDDEAVDLLMNQANEFLN